MNREELINECAKEIMEATPEQLEQIMKWIEVCKQVEAHGISGVYAAYYASHIVFGLSSKEIATSCKCSSSTVTRALNKVKSIIEHEDNK